jgi:polar amino acid transport system substrate-binding protein
MMGGIIVIVFMKKVKETCVVALVVFLAFFCVQVFATKLNILTEHLAPYQIVSKGSIKGLSTEIVVATLNESQYAFDITAYPWALSFSRAKLGKNTCIYSLARIPERESLFKWVGHIASSTVSLYSIKNSPIDISTIEEAKKYNIAVIRDDVTHQFLLTKGFVENENLYVVNNYDALLKLLDLASRHIDLVVLNDDLLKNRVKDLNEASKYKNVFQLKELTLNFHFACSLNTEQKIVDNLINTMKVLEKRGAFMKIRNKWKKSMVNLIN